MSLWPLALLAVVAVATPTFAQPPEPGQLLNEITNDFANIAVSWVDPAITMATKLFVALATIEVVWSGVRWALARHGGDHLLGNILRKLFILMVLFAIVVGGGSWMPFLVSGFTGAGSELSGMTSLNPSSLFAQGIDLSAEMWRKVDEAYTFPLVPFWAWIAPFIVLLAFAALAGRLMIELVQSFIIISGGLLFLGFAGSRFTVRLFQGYLVAATQVGIRLFVLYLMVAVASGLPEEWGSLIGVELTGVGIDMRMFLEVAGGGIVLFMLIWTIPNFASSLIANVDAFNLANIHGSTDE